MVATKDISALDLILQEEAVVLGPKLQHKPVCLECFEEVKFDTFVACKMCGLPFCSVLCRQAGVLHPVECEYVGRCKEKVDKDDLEEDSGVLAAVTALRLLNLKKDKPDVYECIDKLVDNIEQTMKSEDWIIQEKVVQFLKDMIDVELESFLLLKSTELWE